ncbi:hypothetical protein Hanom_Chr03g00254101 [Helianthus anomalus]
MYNTRASLDSRKMSLMQKQRQAIGVWLHRHRWNHMETELFSGLKCLHIILIIFKHFLQG